MSKKTPKTVIEALLNREMGLSEVKNKLLDTIERLRDAANFEKISGKQLKDFWQKEFPSAPFEEEFTLKQIASIDIETFFKKRSVLPSKIQGIIAAIEKAIGKSGAKSKKPQAKTSTKDKSPAATNKIRIYELQYNMLINKCEMMIEILKLAESSLGLSKSKAIDSLAADIKKIDKILTLQHEKISNLV